MQIHELNNFTGTLGASAYLAIDDGTDTGKISSQGLLAATEARIDNIIAGPAPSAQEVTDARRGADGVTYNSLGTAIRTQVTDLKSELTQNVNFINLVEMAYQGGITGMGQGTPFGSISLNTDTDRIRTLNDKTSVNNAIKLLADSSIQIDVDEGYKYSYQVYSLSTGIALDPVSWSNTSTVIEKSEAVGLVLALAKNDNSNISPSEISHIHVYYANDLKQEVEKKLDKFDVDYLFPVKSYNGGFGVASQGDAWSSIDINNLSTRLRTFADASSISNLIYVPAQHSINLSVENGYKYAYQVYSSVTLKGLDTFAYTTDDTTIIKDVATYLAVMLARVDGEDISTSEMSNLTIGMEKDVEEAIDGKLDFTYYQSLSNEQKQIAQSNLGIEASSDIELPFTFIDGIKIYKGKDRYSTNFVPQNKAITGTSKVVVYMSPNGNDSNNGLTVLTPKKTLGSALSVSNVGTIILLEGTYLSGTHYNNFQQVTTEINLIGIGNVVFDNGNNDPIYFYRSLYCENIHFKGGKIACVVKYSTADREATFYRCKFSESKETNGLSVIGGIAYLVECEAYGNAFDGFNYHANEDVSPNIPNYALEVDCVSYGNGTVRLDQSDGQSSNGSTTHDYSYIVRVNGEYYACHGGIIADKDSHSANYGCRAGISTVTDVANYPDRLSNYWSSGSTMYLYDCISYGSKYDTAKIRSGIIVSNVSYDSNYSA